MRQADFPLSHILHYPKCHSFRAQQYQCIHNINIAVEVTQENKSGPSETIHHYLFAIVPTNQVSKCHMARSILNYRGFQRQLNHSPHPSSSKFIIYERGPEKQSLEILQSSECCGIPEGSNISACAGGDLSQRWFDRDTYKYIKSSHVYKDGDDCVLIPKVLQIYEHEDARAESMFVMWKRAEVVHKMS